MTVYSHILPAFREIVDTSVAERIEFMHHDRWIPYPRAETIIDTMRLMTEQRWKNRLTNLLLVGDSNNGKTTIVTRMANLHGKPYLDSENNPIKPIILASTPPDADEKSLWGSILSRFFVVFRSTDTAMKLRMQVVHLLRLAKTKMLILDEFHSALAGTPVRQRHFMEILKLLGNELHIPIVGVGMRSAIQLRNLDPQHASRYDVLDLPLWSADTPFQTLLRSFEKVLPLREVSNLSSPELAAMIHNISKGNLGDTHRLLVKCATEAIESGKEKIDSEILRSLSWVKPTRGLWQKLS